METLSIAYDSREQRPVHDLDGREIAKGVTVKYEEASLSVFDYALISDLTPTSGKLMTPGWSIERKGLSDLVGSLFNSANYKRELAKIERANAIWGNSGLGNIYVVEGDLEAISKYDFSRFPSGKITPKVLISKINQMRYRYNVQFILCASRIQAEYTIVSLLRQHSKSVQFKNAMKEKAKDTDYANKLV